MVNSRIEQMTFSGSLQKGLMDAMNSSVVPSDGGKVFVSSLQNSNSYRGLSFVVDVPLRAKPPHELDWQRFM